MRPTLLQRYLKREGITGRELWKRVKKKRPVSESHFNHIILGERPSPELAQATATVTGLSRETLIYGAVPGRVRRDARKGFPRGTVPKNSK